MAWKGALRAPSRATASRALASASPALGEPGRDRSGLPLVLCRERGCCGEGGESPPGVFSGSCLCRSAASTARAGWLGCVGPWALASVSSAFGGLERRGSGLLPASCRERACGGEGGEPSPQGGGDVLWGRPCRSAASKAPADWIGCVGPCLLWWFRRSVGSRPFPLPRPPPSAHGCVAGGGGG